MMMVPASMASIPRSSASRPLRIRNLLITTSSVKTTERRFFHATRHTQSSHNNKRLSKLTDDPATWENSHLLSVQQITRQGLQLLLRQTDTMRQLVHKKGGDDRLKHQVMGTLFYERSTRTLGSFEAAMQRLGGTCVHFDATIDDSKESLEDTLQCLEAYTDIVVMRHPISGSIPQALQVANKPLINGGDGAHEHPTQALLDVYTIYHELGLHNLHMTNNDNQSLKQQEEQPLTVVLAGDLKHNRTVHSLAALLAQGNMETTSSLTLRYCSPPGLELPQKLQDYIRSSTTTNNLLTETINVKQESYLQDRLAQACEGAQVLYVTQTTPTTTIDQPPFPVVDREFLHQNKIPDDLILLHPLPRSEREIATEVDADPRAAYFRQVHNGMLVRMALLSLIFGKA